MRGPSWLTLRQAKGAIAQGRLEDAKAILLQPTAQGHRKTGDLLRELARAYVERGERLLDNDNLDRAWQSLREAEELHANERSSDRLREALTRLGLAQVRGALQAGEPQRSLQIIGQLRDNRVRHPELQLLEEITRKWLTAQEFADLAEYGQGLQIVQGIQRQLPAGSARLDELQQRLEQQEERLPALLSRLNDASSNGRWNESVELAEQVLALAPHHTEARKARARAWRSIEPLTVAMRPGPESQEPVKLEKPDEPSQNFYLWVDGVGGYLVCLSKYVTLGQAAPDSSVDVPLIADVSRMHATLCSDEEGAYVLEAPRPVQVNGKPVTRTVLNPEDRITLGASCQLRFTRPVPVSNSARVDVTSGHRIASGVDAILLMGSTIVLGPGAQSHVLIRELKQNLVLFRNKEGLGVRYSGKLWINDQLAEERSQIKGDSQFVGEQFSFAIQRDA